MKTRLRIRILSLLFLSFFTGLPSWILAQSLAGQVLDELSQRPLAGANISLTPGNFGAITDSNGNFEITDITAGHYSLSISFVGYGVKQIPNIWIRSGNQDLEIIQLKRQYTELAEIEIREQENPLELGRLSITEEQLNRFAATYYDPARLISNSPDIAVTNDQNNRVSVRGMSPNYNVWRLHGVEIVNPNHLSNAGTFSDQPIATGGSVNIISAQMLGQSSFRYGAFDPSLGNSIGGIFDMQLRKGNNNRRQYVAQASLIGLELATEGPFSKNNKASYAMNYRYSFTGLLTNLGVDFGGESIGFQDLSFSVNLPFKDGSELSVFALGGLNFNNFDALSLEDSELQKDRSDIYFDGKMGGVGASYTHKLGQGFSTHSVAFSGSENIREQNYYDSLQNQVNTALTNRTNQIISWRSRFVTPLKKGSLDYGLMANYYSYQGIDGDTDFNVEQYLLTPYINLKHQLTKRMDAQIGVNMLVNDQSNSAVDPRLALNYFLNDGYELYLKAGLFSQLLNPYNYYFVFATNGGDFLAVNQDFGFQSSQRVNLGIRKSLKDWTLSLEGFLYYLPTINYFDGVSDQNSSAQSTGISAVANRNIYQGWYLNAGGSLYNSTWGEDQNFDNRYNTNFNLNLGSGKEWTKVLKDKVRIFSINTRVLYQGGLKEPLFPSDELSKANPATNVLTDNTSFFRLDFRVQWTWNKDGRSSSLALDLQNVSNYQNEAYRYLDTFTGNIETQFQLGLIPILTYRVEF